MHDTTAWSISLGRWSGIQVRLHALFLLFGVLTIYLSTLSSDRDLVAIGLMSLAILFVSVLLHEFAHCYAALRVGGQVQEVVVGPFGGLVQPQVPHEPQSELYTALAGPVLNLFIFLATVPLLLIVGDVSLLGLLNPLRPENVVEGPLQVVFLKLTFWLNWILVLVNLLPAFPFDGGRVLRAMLWPVVGYRPAIMQVARVAKITAVLLCVAAWWMHDGASEAIIPAWLPLVLIAIFLLFSAKQEVAKLDQQDYGDELFGYDFSQGYTSLERDAESTPPPSKPGPVRRWLLKRRAEREAQQRAIEAAEEGRVDDILARLHTLGMQNLSAEDRALLNRVSVRYRNRMKQ